MSRKKELREAIADTESEIAAIEKKLFRSQTVLLLDLLEGKKPDAKEMEFFKMYAQLIERARKRLVQYNEEYTNGSKNKNDNY